ncbi:GntR family transcriptional regulator [Puniceibacterium confluentis]|uniref:GntR family transcriptional regulator n=2 Tax=Puniceibacterium confluentis TaxID=1958944 RepID=UPI0011B80132|nr:GntR family transcriptional regulator [Puniceibacterium confluentis]
MNSPDTTPLRSLARLAASDRVAEALSLAIHEHRLTPGTKLGEDDIGEVYGVSRTIVRAALQRLAHIQLVEIHRNRGAYVAQPSQQEAREVFEARELLEPRTAHMAATRATAADIATLRRHISEEHAAMAGGDRGRALHLSGLFHKEIARIAGQETIGGFIATLIARSSLIIALYWRRESALCESHAHHALIEAIAASDGTSAEALMRSHLVDLHTALDLRQTTAPARTLKQALINPGT